MAQRRGLGANLANVADAVYNTVSSVAPLAAAAGGGLAAGVTGDKALSRLLHRVEQLEKRRAAESAPSKAVKKAVGRALAATTTADHVARVDRIEKGMTVDAMPVTAAGTVVVGEPTVRMRAGKKYIKHREIISDVLSNGTSAAYFTHSSTVLQPGDGSMGKWLAEEAQGWEQYRVVSCSALYVPSAGTSDRGQLALVVDYDALDSTPEDQQAASSFANSAFGPVFGHIRSNFSASKMMTPGPRKFVRTGPLHFLNSRTNDCGRLSVVSKGVEAAALTFLGTVWLEYEIEFAVPHTRGANDMINSVPASSLHVGQDVTYSPTNVADTYHPAYNFKTLNNLHIVVDQVDPTILRLPRGVYHCRAMLSYSRSTGTSGRFRFYPNGPTVTNYYNNDIALVPTVMRTTEGSGDWQFTVEFYAKCVDDDPAENYLQLSIEVGQSSGNFVIRKSDANTLLGPWFTSALDVTLVSEIY